ncbi:MAG: OmpH family outer membrane protein [Fimbriimonadaceae bacterium]|nr:OmpH family outer membrane protein [Fimbriimonadaceae bacterium]QYK57986.1 MAG: OmpH family outer membrane protein [Fimbriimonadaceae bacterium]
MQQNTPNFVTKPIAWGGWALAAALAGFMALSGFQTPASKVGIIDMDKVIFESEMGKKNADDLEAAVKSRQGVLEFAQTHRVLTLEQAQELKNLSIKPTLTDQEKQKLDKVRADVIQAAKNFDSLNQKSNPTEEDRNLLQEYNGRIQTTGNLLSEWNQQFQQELEALRNKMIQDSTTRANQILKDLAKKEGYSTVFLSRVAPYAANDLTDSVVKSMNAPR